MPSNSSELLEKKKLSTTGNINFCKGILLNEEKKKKEGLEEYLPLCKNKENERIYTGL